MQSLQGGRGRAGRPLGGRGGFCKYSKTQCYDQFATTVDLLPWKFPKRPCSMLELPTQ